MDLLRSRAHSVRPPFRWQSTRLTGFLFDSLSGHKRRKNCLRPPSYEKPAAGCLYTLSSLHWVSTAVSHHSPIILILPFLGTAGTTPALPHPLFVATTPFPSLPSRTEALVAAMSPLTEVAAGGARIDPTLLVVGMSPRRNTAVAGANQLPATVPGRTESTLSAGAVFVWRRSFSVNPTTPPNSIPASISKSTTISPSRLPVPESQTPSLPLGPPHLTPFSWRTSPPLVTTLLPPSKSIRFLS